MSDSIRQIPIVCPCCKELITVNIHKDGTVTIEDWHGKQA